MSTSRKFQWQNVLSQNRPWCRLGPCQQYSNYKKFCRIKPSIPKRSPSRNVLHPETSSIPKRPPSRNVLHPETSSIPKRPPSRNILHPETSSIPKRRQFRNVSDRIRLRYESLETKSPTKRKFPLRIDLSHYTVCTWPVFTPTWRTALYDCSKCIQKITYTITCTILKIQKQYKLKNLSSMCILPSSSYLLVKTC